MIGLRIGLVVAAIGDLTLKCEIRGILLVQCSYFRLSVATKACSLVLGRK